MALTLDHTMRSLVAAAELVQRAWIAAAETLTGISPAQRDAYVAGLTSPRSLVYPDQGNALAVRVVNVAPQYQWLESGSPAIHLPTVIRWAESRSARRSKRGVYYLIIPFRHIAPRGRAISAASLGRTMPEQLYRRALHTPLHREVSLHGIRGIGPYVPRQAINRRPGYTARPKVAGMQRVPGERGKSQYLTFRTMTADSPGWWLPARAAIPLSKEVQKATAGSVRRLIEAGVQADIEAALRQQMGGRP